MIRVSWQQTVAPLLQPITITEAKQHARINQDNDDAVISRFVNVATETAEEYLGRGLLTQTMQMSLDWFYDVIYLPKAAPLQSITSIQYYDQDGNQQTLASSVYDFDTTSRPAKVVLKANQVWPTLQALRRTPRVTITYVVGWTSAALIPERIKQGIRMYVAYLDLNRDGFEQDAEKAREAAEACWTDCVHWIEPQFYVDWVGQRSY